MRLSLLTIGLIYVHGSCDDCALNGDCTLAYRGIAPGSYCGYVGGIQCCCPVSKQCSATLFDCRCRNAGNPGLSPSQQIPVNQMPSRSDDIIVVVAFFSVLLLFMICYCCIRSICGNSNAMVDGEDAPLEDVKVVQARIMRQLSNMQQQNNKSPLNVQPTNDQFRQQYSISYGAIHEDQSASFTNLPAQPLPRHNNDSSNSQEQVYPQAAGFQTYQQPFSRYEGIHSPPYHPPQESDSMPSQQPFVRREEVSTSPSYQATYSGLPAYAASSTFQPHDVSSTSNESYASNTSNYTIVQNAQRPSTYAPSAPPAPSDMKFS